MSLLFLNVFAVGSLVVMAGILLATYAWIGSTFLPAALHSDSGNEWLQWPIALTFVLAALWALAKSFGSMRPPRRLLAIACISALPIVVVTGSATLAARFSDYEILRSPSFVVPHALTIGVGVLGVVALAVSLSRLSRRARYSAVAGPLSRLLTVVLTLRLLQVLAFFGFAWSLSFVLRQFTGVPALIGVAFFFLGLVAPMIASRYVGRASPHRPYRNLLMRCFGIIRTADGKASRLHNDDDAKLSLLKPPPFGQTDSFPELLVCAAANVSDVGVAPAGSNVLSIVFSPNDVRIPAVDGALMSTPLFERYQRRMSFRGDWTTAVTLPSAIAITGAAVSPAMGRKTRNHLRAVFAALNIRLGVWMPNLIPSGPGASERPAPNRDQHVKVELGSLICELFGFHSASKDLLYVTDGGHYDNLGLVELLRRRCSVIWCVDGSGDRAGSANALAEALRTASGEGYADVDIDLSRFDLAEGLGSGRAPFLSHTHAVGSIRYTNPSSVGTLIVVKLGLTERSPDQITAYRSVDHDFPHHSTLKQLFKAERFDAYRSLGWASTTEACADDVVLTELAARGFAVDPTQAVAGNLPSGDVAQPISPAGLVLDA